MARYGDEGAVGGSSVDVEGKLAERRLPHNLEAERSILGALLVDVGAAAPVFQILSEDDFYSPRHGKLYGVLRDLYDRYAAVDEVMALEELQRHGLSESVGGMELLDELVQRVPTTANAEYYARIVREKAILRLLVGTCSRIIQGVYESGYGAQEQLDRAEQELFLIGDRGLGRDFIPLSEVIDEQFQRIAKDPGDTETTILSGFTDLDQMTTGLHPGELVIVAGRPSMGKTSFSLNCVEAAALAGKTVAFFSLEVSKDQLVQNLLCSCARVDAHRIRQRSLSRDMWNKLVDAAAKLSQAHVYVDDTPGLSPLTLKAKARRLRDKHGLNLVVIDYLQLMESEGAESRQQEISAISRSLKAMAKELKIPVIAISQLSRGVENRESHKPRLSDLRESGAIEQDADLVLLLYREEYYEPKKEEAKGKAEVIVAKQRNGPTGSVELAFFGQHLRFENLARSYEDEPFPVTETYE